MGRWRNQPQCLYNIGRRPRAAHLIPPSPWTSPWKPFSWLTSNLRACLLSHEISRLHCVLSVFMGWQRCQNAIAGPKLRPSTNHAERRSCSYVRNWIMSLHVSVQDPMMKQGKIGSPGAHQAYCRSELRPWAHGRRMFVGNESHADGERTLSSFQEPLKGYGRPIIGRHSYQNLMTPQLGADFVLWSSNSPGNPAV